MVGEVDRLGHGVVHVLLEGGLHADVPFGRHVVGGDEHLLEVVGHVRHLVEGAARGHLLHEVLAVEAAAPHGLLEERVRLRHLRVVHDVPDEGQGEQRLHPAGAPGDDADGPRGRDGGEGGVPQAPVPLLPEAPLEVGEDAPLAGEGLGGHLGLLVDEPHDLAGQGHRFLRVVGDAEFHQHVGPAHDPQADLAIALGHALDLRQRVPVHVDDVIQEVRGDVGDPLQFFPIDANHS